MTTTLDALTRFHRMVAGNHFYGRTWGRLNQRERDIVTGFIHIHRDDEPPVFETYLNRLFLDDTSKPKRWLDVMDLLVNFNSYRQRTK